MTKQLQVFSFENNPIQSLNINNELFLRAIPLAELLGYKNPRQALSSHVDKEDVQKLDSLTQGGKQKVLYVNESGMYALIFSSKLDQAKRFKKWVTSEIIPTIRKTGSYSLTINEKQRYLISKAIDERVYRTGEKHQTIYHKLYDQFKISSYKELPVVQFETAIEFLGGVSTQPEALTSDELCELAWVVKAAEHMRSEIEEIESSLRTLKSEKAIMYYTMSREYRHVIQNCKRIVQDKIKTTSINRHEISWQRVLPFLQ